MGIYTWDFIKDMKSLYVSHDYYGGTEGDILNALSSTDRSGLMFEEIEDITNIDNFDVEYIAWKAETIRIPKGSQLDFVDWLETKKKPTSLTT